jgi:hypothetical protein
MGEVTGREGKGREMYKMEVYENKEAPRYRGQKGATRVHMILPEPADDIDIH